MIEFFFSLLFLLGIVGFVLSVVTLVRNEQVYHYRINLLKKVSEAAKQDINEGRYTEWKDRYDAWNSVSYHTMVWQFWKDLDDFYPDKSFAENEPYYK